MDVWKKGREFKKGLEVLAETFPPEEKYRFVDQIVRSVRSTNANIAEGRGRFGYPDQVKYCINARGSSNEMLNHLIDAFDCRYVTKERLAAYKNMYDEVMALLNGYIVYLRNLIKKRKPRPREE